MDFTVLLRRDYHRVFAYLGRHDWLSYHEISLDDPRQSHLPREQRGTTFVESHFPARPQSIPQAEWSLVIGDIASKKSDRIKLTWWYMLSKALAEGPKVFTPSVEQCESMEEIDIDIAPGDFQQPYPTMIYQFPHAYAKGLSERLAYPTSHPVYGITYTDKPSGFVLLGVTMSNDDSFVVMIPPTTPTLEWALKKKMDNRSGDIMSAVELILSNLAERVCCNAAMLLMQYPTKIAPYDPKAYAKHRSKPKFAHFATGDFQSVSFEQNIIIREVRDRPTGTEAEPHGTHAAPKPHWRRGHWKMQAHGPQHSLRKRILIRPVFVRGFAFTGDMSKTNVTIRKD